MNKYELMLVLSSVLAEEQRETLITKIKDLLTGKQAEIASFEKMGMKRLAYPINFKHEGFYALVNFSAQPEAIAQVEKALRIMEGVERSLIIRR